MVAIAWEGFRGRKDRWKDSEEADEKVMKYG
jgi:hypothetical protein